MTDSRDIVSFGARKGLFDERTVRARLDRQAPTVARLVQHGILDEPSARALQKEFDALPPDVEAAMRDPANNVGRYVRVRELGRGGFGSVWQAWDTELGRAVALKFLKAQEPEDVARFKREAHLAAKLSHPNIASVFGVGEVAGQLFIAMQLVGGKGLDQGGLDARQALEAVRDAARAVHYAHGQGVIHRDLKPPNIMRDDSGRVFVMDFGLAKSAGAESSLSVSGMVFGTPAFMPPEQARGNVHAIDARSDVYSLGATLYRLITGKNPYEGPGAYEILLQVLEHDPPSPRAVRANLHADVETIILKAMAKDPARRYPDAAAFADDVDRYLKGEEIQARRASAAYRAWRFVKRNKTVSALASAFVVGALGLAVYAYTRRGTVELKGFPPDARVWIGGAEVTDRTLHLRAGDYKVIVRHPLYEPFVRDLVVKRGETRDLAFDATRLSGELEMDCSSDGVTAEFTGPVNRRLGFPFKDRFDTGRYHVTMEKLDFYAVEFDVDVEPRASRSMRLAFPPALYWVYPFGNTPLWPVVADLDGNGSLEIVSGTSDGRVMAFEAAAPERNEPRKIWDDFVELPGPKASPAVADMNGDGALDLIYAADGGRQAVVLDGKTGRSIYSHPLDADRATYPQTPAAIDVDGDGRPEIVASSRDSGLVCLSLEKGPLWERRWGYYAGMASVSDFDGDGRPDLIVSGPDAVHVVSASTGKDLKTIPLGAKPVSSRAVADLDADGTPDVVLAVESDRIRAVSGKTGSILWTASVDDNLLGMCSQVFRESPSGPILVAAASYNQVTVLDGLTGTLRWKCRLEPLHRPSLVVADFDSDGREDVAVSHDYLPGRKDRKGWISAWRAVDGRPIRRFFYGATAYLSAADVNLDGFMDLVAGGMDGRLAAILGPKVLWDFRAPAEFDASPTLGDFDRDGKPDLAAITRRGDLFVFSAEGGGILLHEIMNIDSRSRPTFADVDGDGILDVVGARWPGHSAPGAIYAYSGANSRSLWEALKGEQAQAEVLVVDLEGRGRPSVIAGTWAPKPRLVALDARTGDVRWSVEAPLKREFARGADATDVDGDGVMDVVGGNFDGFVRAWSGRDGAVLWEFDTKGPIRARVRVFGSLAYVASNSGRFFALDVATGKESWRAPIAPLPDDANLYLYPRAAAVLADVDADGKPEILFGDIDGRVHAWNPGTGGNHVVVTMGPIGIATDVATADFDGDRKLEIVACDEGGRVVCVSPMRRETLWTCKISGRINAAPQVADFNGDGVPDVAVASADARLPLVVVLSGRGNLRQGPVPRPAEWSLKTGSKILPNEDF